MSPIYRNQENDGIKESNNIPRRDNQVRELWLLVRWVILSKYLIGNKEYTWT